MKNILIPTDFSDNAYNALYYATQLLKSKKCVFHIVNVYTEQTPLKNKSVNALSKILVLKQLHEESKVGLQNTFHRIVLDNENPNHTYKITSKYQNLTEAVIETVAKKNIDFVVMGNKCKIGVKEFFFGSNIMNVINHIKTCPVLIVPKEIEFKAPKEVAFATDYKRNYNAAPINPLLFIASLFTASVRVMHINEEEKLNKTQIANKKILDEYLYPVTHSLHWMPYFSLKSDVINTFVEDMNIDILTMIKYEHNFLEKLISEPVIKEISICLNIPFLVIPYFN